MIVKEPLTNDFLMFLLGYNNRELCKFSVLSARKVKSQ